MNKQEQNQKQEKIARLLAQLAPEIADVYKGGIQVLEQNNPDKISQSANSLREVIYMLTELDQVKEAGRRINQNRFSKVRKKSIIENLDPLAGASDYYVLHTELVDMIDWFSSVAHHTKYPTHAEFLEKVADFENKLEHILKPHFEVIDKIDQLLALAAPTRKELNELKLLLSRNTSAYNYFFYNATPSWFTILKNEGYLENPQHTTNENRRQLTGWPPADYLQKMAQIRPKEVTGIILGFSTPKKKVLVHVIRTRFLTSTDIRTNNAHIS